MCGKIQGASQLPETLDCILTGGASAITLHCLVQNSSSVSICMRQRRAGVSTVRLRTSRTWVLDLESIWVLFLTAAKAAMKSVLVGAATLSLRRVSLAGGSCCVRR